MADLLVQDTAIVNMFDGGPEQVPALRTTIPHLVLTYHSAVDGWTVTQVPSGQSVTSFAHDLRVVLAALPALVGLDWSNHLVRASPSHKAAYAEFRRLLDKAADQ